MVGQIREAKQTRVGSRGIGVLFAFWKVLNKSTCPVGSVDRELKNKSVSVGNVGSVGG